MTLFTVSSAYNFTTTGHSKYTIEASNLFHFVDANNEVSAIRADTRPHVATLTSGKLVVARPALTKRSQFNSCSSSQQSALNNAAPYANNYASSALSYLKQHTSSTTRYKMWFGSYTSSRHSLVQTHFTNIASHDYSTFTYDCTCTDPGVYAMVDPNQLDTIYLCGAFWNAPTTGTDSQAGTLIHEVRPCFRFCFSCASMGEMG